MGVQEESHVYVCEGAVIGPLDATYRGPYRVLEAGQGGEEGVTGGCPKASHVYVRKGAVIGPLDATYRGPYRVLVRERRKLLLEIGATRTWVPVDRLKQHVGKMSP